METMTADNWWDKNHADESVNLLKHFSDKELHNELARRQGERRKLEIMKIVGPREAVGYLIVETGDDGNGEHREFHAEWELHIIFSNAEKHKFTFSSKVGQTAETLEDFRTLYFPNLTRLDSADYQRMVDAKGSLRKKKKKICHSP
jgi:hypothetical protein